MFAIVVYWCLLLNNVFIVWLCHNLSICHPVGYLDCFYCVAVCLQTEHTDSVCMYLEVGLPDHSICVCSAFVNTGRYFPKCWFFTFPSAVDESSICFSPTLESVCLFMFNNSGGCAVDTASWFEFTFSWWLLQLSTF